MFLGISAIGWFTHGVSSAAWLSRRKPPLAAIFTPAITRRARQLGQSRTEMVRIMAHFHLMAVWRRGWNRHASQIGFIPNQTGTGLEMKIPSRPIRISLLGGSGTVIGAILGAYFLTQSMVCWCCCVSPHRWNDFYCRRCIVGRTGIRWAAAFAHYNAICAAEICRNISPPTHYRRKQKTHAQQNKTKRWHDESMATL